MDWKGLGYLVSMISVLILGAVAWPRPEEPHWKSVALVAGMATSMIGMAFRYIAHRKEQKKVKLALAEARRN